MTDEQLARITTTFLRMARHLMHDPVVRMAYVEQQRKRTRRVFSGS